MTLNEFKAWLDGFSDAMGDAPTPEQWAKVKEKLATVSPEVVNIGDLLNPKPDWGRQYFVGDGPNTYPPRFDRTPLPYSPLGPVVTCGPALSTTRAGTGCVADDGKTRAIGGSNG